jgi:hypothetical protein
MNLTIIGLCVFIFLSFLSTIVVLAALARASQCSRWEERAEQKAGHDRKPEPKTWPSYRAKQPPLPESRT